MKKEVFGIILVSFLSLIFLFSIVSATNVANCSGLTQSTVYTLTGLATNTTGGCFKILQENLTLDCQGNWIVYGGGTNNQYGIDNSGGYRNITIKNCRINQTSGQTNAAVYFSGAENGTIFNNSFEISANYGVFYGSGIAANISSNYFTSSSDHAAIFMSKSLHNYINFNNINFSAGLGDGFKFDNNVNYTRIEGNIINTSSGRGMMIQSRSYHNKILYNNVSSIANSAIEIDGGYNMSVKGNFAYAFAADTYGIALISSTNTSDVINNTVTTFGSGGYGISIENSFDNMIRNNTINATSSYPAFVTGNNIQEFNNTLLNNIANGKYIYYYFFNDSDTLENVEASNIFVFYSNNLTFSGVNITGGGFYSYYMQNSTIDSCNFSTPEYALKMEDYSDYNTIQNSFFSATGSMTYPVYLETTHNNTLTNNEILSSGDISGNIYLNSGENNTVIHNSLISYGATGYAFAFESEGNSTIFNNTIRIEEPTGFAIINVGGSEFSVYNNIINISANGSGYVYLDDPVNYYNISKTAGTNIIGRSYLGGNFWTNTSGTGYSDTCTDSDGDYICDSSYNFSGTYNFDYLPLAARTTLTTTTDTGGDTTGASGNVPASIVAEKTMILSKVEKDKPAVIKDFEEESGIEEISIEVSEDSEDVKVSVTTYDSNPSAVSAKGGKVYNYLKIDTENLDNLKKAVIKVKIPISWREQEGLDKEDVAVFKFIDSDWNELNTEYKASTEEYDYYDVELEGFSYFAIGEKQDDKIFGLKYKGKFLGKYISIIIALAIIITFYIISRKKSKIFN